VVVSGNYVYVGDTDGGFANVEPGLHVIDVSNPTNCVRVGGYAQGWNIRSVALQGNYAYIANGYLEVLDVSNPANPVRVGGFNSGSVVSADVSGNYAYIAEWDSDDGLKIIDVSNPTNCFQVLDGDAYYPTYAHAVAAWGRYAYLIDRDDGLSIYDVSNPTNTIFVGLYRTAGLEWFSSVTIVDGRIYLAAGSEGLIVLPTLNSLQFSVRVDATPGQPFTLEAATNLHNALSWTPLLTTNVAAMPFDYVDFDVKASDKPRKFYRVRQP
jgi:hypothetical protein